MGKTVDFEKVRRRRRLRETVKRLVVLVLIVGAVGGVILFNNVFVEYGLSTRISDLMGALGGDGFPVDLPGGIIRDVKDVNGSLAVLNDTNLFLYNKKGRAITNLQQMTDKTVLLTNESRALTYDVGSKEYSLHTTSRSLSGAAENGILAADLAKNNTYALVTASRQYVAEVAVYKSPSENASFRWYSPDHHITGVSIAPKGDMMAASCVMTDNGMIASSVILFHLGVGEKLEEISFPQSLILDMEFYETDRIGVLTDREYVVLDAAGSRLHSYSLADSQIAGLERYGREVLLRTEYREARTSQIILLDEECGVKGQFTAANNIKGMAMGQRRIYILDDTGIESYDHSLNSMEKLERRGITNIHLAGDRLYYCTSEEICLL